MASTNERQMAVVGTYKQSSIKGRIEQFLLENVGKVATTQQMAEVARDPETGEIPPRWHQRISELRTDSGYSIHTYRDSSSLKPGEYVLISTDKRTNSGKRVKCEKKTWEAVLDRAKNCCEWEEDGQRCLLEEGMVDDVGGGTVKLTPDHVRPHSVKSDIDPKDPKAWRALCGRHQVMKKNYWDSSTGKLNIEALLQSASVKEKKAAYIFLKNFFGE